MFSSNQNLVISGNLNQEGELEMDLEFALKKSGYAKNMEKEEIARGCKLLYQITKDGKYCIGWGFGDIPEGWKEYPCIFDVEIVGKIIRQYIEETYGGNGYIMKCIKDDDNVEEIKNSFYGIVYFEPFKNFYAK